MENNKAEQEELMPLQEYIFWLNSMTTTELCKEFGWPLPVWKGDVQKAAEEFFVIDARLWDLAKTHAQKLAAQRKQSDYLTDEKIVLLSKGLRYGFPLTPVSKEAKKAWQDGMKYYRDNILFSFDFVIWYSGMEKEKVQNAYNRYLREVVHVNNQQQIPDLCCGKYDEAQDPKADAPISNTGLSFESDDSDIYG